MTESVGKFGRPVKAPQYPNDGRNYEYRTIPDVSESIKINRDGDVSINGVTSYHMGVKGIPKHDGTYIPVRTAVGLAFPDIPLRESPTPTKAMSDATNVTAGEEYETDLQVQARLLVRDYYNQLVNQGEVDYPLVTTQQVYVVWFSKTLGNWKAMVGTVNPDDRYFEVTYNGETEETYVDHYEKQGQMLVSTPSIRKERAERAAMREEIYTVACTTVNRLKKDGGYDNATIAMKMGISESVVRCLLDK